MDRSVFLIAGLIILFGSLSGATSINTDSIETSNITSTESQLSIGSITNFTDNALTNVNNLFFSSTAYIVQESNGDDLVFQLDNASGTRSNFLMFDNSALSAVFEVAVDMSSNQINNLADPTEPQDAATMSWVNENDDVEPDTNASTECSADEVLSGSGCITQYTSSDDSDSSLGNEGANSLSFDTGNGVLTLDREHRSSLTQDLDGRYPTSDTNTQLDDQPAQSNVDINGNNIQGVSSVEMSDQTAMIRTAGDGSSSIELRDKNNSQTIIRANEGGYVEIPNGDLIMNRNAIDKPRLVNPMIPVDNGDRANALGNVNNEMLWADKEKGWTMSSNVTPTSGSLTNLWRPDGSTVTWDLTSVSAPIQITVNGVNNEYGWDKGMINWMNDDGIDYLKVEGYDGSSWVQIDERTSRDSAYEIWFNLAYSYERYRFTIGDPKDPTDRIDLQYMAGFQQEASTYDVGAYMSRSGGTMHGNVDMNNNRIQNAEVEATEGFRLPVGPDAY
mgnify:CR=1 FL=1